jgi:hypothetical protein
MTPAAFRKFALSLPGAHEEPHFERTSFRVGKKIFATMTADGREAMVPVHPLERCLALLVSDPDAYVDYGGWTRRMCGLGLRLARLDAAHVRELMVAAHARIAPRPRPPAKSPRGR